MPLLLNGQPLAGQDSVWASATLDKTNHSLILKLINMSARHKQKEIKIVDAIVRGTITMTVLANVNLNIANNLDQPDAIEPITTRLNIGNRKLLLDLEPYSFTVVRFTLH